MKRKCQVCRKRHHGVKRSPNPMTGLDGGRKMRRILICTDCYLRAAHMRRARQRTRS